MTVYITQAECDNLTEEEKANVKSMICWDKKSIYAYNVCGLRTCPACSIKDHYMRGIPKVSYTYVEFGETKRWSDSGDFPSWWECRSCHFCFNSHHEIVEIGS